jgi:hypothetical protein
MPSRFAPLFQVPTSMLLEIVIKKDEYFAPRINVEVLDVEVREGLGRKSR